jgi:hypothetical protein
MSEENNCPEKAVQEVSGALNGTSTVLHVAGPHEPGSFIQL